MANIIILIIQSENLRKFSNSQFLEKLRAPEARYRKHKKDVFYYKQAIETYHFLDTKTNRSLSVNQLAH